MTPPKSSAPLEMVSDSATAPRVLKARRARARTQARSTSVFERGKTSAEHFLEGANPSMKPLLVGIGIGAALMGTALALRSKKGGIALFSGEHAALAGSLTKTALLAVAGVVGGQPVRTVATQALLDVANAFKA
jgi:hypothetical protein